MRVRGPLWSALVVMACAGCDARAVDVAEAQTPAPDSASHDPFESREACLAEVGAGRRAPHAASTARIGSLNVRWFPRGRARRSEHAEGTDVAWLACLIAWLDVDVIAVQEFVSDLEGRRATADLLDLLRARTGSRWSAELDECAAGRQHVGLLGPRAA